MLLRQKLLVLSSIFSLAIFSLTSTVFAQAAGKEWAFDVYLDKNKIGQHSFKLSDSGDLLSEADFKIKIVFITAYTYHHVSKEQWKATEQSKDSCLTKLEADTIENKVVSKVNGQVNNGKFELKAKVGKDEKVQSLPECVMTFAYWNPKILTQTKLLNPQNGDYLKANFKLIGDEKIEVNGEQKSAKHYHLFANSAEANADTKPKLNIDLWYDNNNDWLALKSITPEGYTISYKRK